MASRETLCCGWQPSFSNLACVFFVVAKRIREPKDLFLCRLDEEDLG